MRRRKIKTEDLNYWPSIADFMLALFMVALILGVTNTMLMYSEQKTNRTEGRPVALVDNKKPEQSMPSVSPFSLEQPQERPTQAKNQVLPIDDKRLIQYTEDDGLKFDDNSADPSRFIRFLNTDRRGFERWKSIAEEYPDVNTIEIIGHTDTREVHRLYSNVDRLRQGLLGELKPDEMKSASNADLGLWRAVAVKQLWDKWVQNTISEAHEKSLLTQLDIFCYSASYGVPPNRYNKLRGEALNAISRRIEVRFVKLKR